MTEHNPFTATLAFANLTSKRQMLELHGTANQLERYRAGLLPDDELLSLARQVLFQPFGIFKRWSKLGYGDLKHDKGCRRGMVTFTTRPAPDLDHGEWAMYKKIRDTVFAVDSVLRTYSARGQCDIIEHIGSCSGCRAEVFGRSAAIRIEWAGHPLSREYALEQQ